MSEYRADNIKRQSYAAGRWSAKVVMLRKPHMEALLEWAKASEMGKTAFFRQSLLLGAQLIAQEKGLASELPVVPDFFERAPVKRQEVPKNRVRAFLEGMYLALSRK